MMCCGLADLLSRIYSAARGYSQRRSQIAGNGKWKLNRNRPQPDREGVAAGLTALFTPAAGKLAPLVK